MFIRVASSAFAGAGFDYLDYSDNGISFEIGDLVVVPFNKSLVTGFVINIIEKSEVSEVLPVHEKIEGGNKLTPELIDLAYFVSKTYFCPLSRVILSVIPSMLTNKVKQFYTIVKREEFETPKETEILERIENGKGYIGKLDESEKRVLRSLIKKEVLDKSFKLEAPKASPKMLRAVRLTGVNLLKPTPKQTALIDFLNEKDDYIPTLYLIKNKISTSNIINTLIEKKVLRYVDVREDRIPPWIYIAPSDVTFTQGQQDAFDTIKESISENKRETFLLFGVTASGKTEVYIKLIEEIIKKGKTALVLLPEIALTNQVMNIFKSRFGKPVAVLHSGLSAGERLDEWDRIRDGKAKIVLGARSAVFAPLKNIGLIVIDEEHDAGYKQDTPPKYNTRDVAIYRAEREGAVCVFGSATPSVESFYKAREGEYKLLTLPERVPGRRLPTVYMADLKGSLDKSVFTPLLLNKIGEKLSKGEQIILLQNRRAYFTYVMCPDCGWVAKCPNCDVSLKYHYKTDALLCHHCGFVVKKP
ncbi:MAG: primosomal protein N', partial [Lachnospiraceae bacterium]|nr:primosomal protein N' [Lachnospiraceae bacterium]